MGKGEEEEEEGHTYKSSQLNHHPFPHLSFHLLSLHLHPSLKETLTKHINTYSLILPLLIVNIS